MAFETSKSNELEHILHDPTVKPQNLRLSLLEEITRNFSEKNRIGKGGSAEVYKGSLHMQNGTVQTVAVKRLSGMFVVDEKTFYQELDSLMNAKHENIVRFLGYCANTELKICKHEGKNVRAEIQQKLLCFEYMPNGSLDRHISEANEGLEWKTRYQILKGICEGLHYLHTNRILHLDLKPANILLNEDMKPKISDFGLSKWLDENQSRVITSSLSGTMGYMAPERYDKVITFKSDIYSLGIIIFEILTGRKGPTAVDKVLESWQTRFRTPQDDAWLEQVRVCTEIGTACMNPEPTIRPSTQHIIEILDATEREYCFAETDICTSSAAYQEKKGSTELQQGTSKVPGQKRSMSSTSQHLMALYLTVANRHFEYAWSGYCEDHFFLPNKKIALVTEKRVILLQSLDPYRKDKNPPKILWDVPWEDVLSLEMAKAGYQRPSHVIIHLKKFKRSENFVRLIRCNVDGEHEPQALALCSSLWEMWRSHKAAMEIIPLRCLISSRGTSSDVKQRLINCTINFQKIWSSEAEIRILHKLFHKKVAGNGRVFSIWRPLCPDGYVSIGDVAHVGYHPPHVAAVYKNVNGNFALPVGYDLIWRNCAKDYRSPVSIWLPRPPGGYAALGCVAVPAFEEPPLGSALCVDERLTEDADYEEQIVWESSDGYPWGCYIYQVQSGSSQFMALRFPKEQSELRPKKILESFVQQASVTPLQEKKTCRVCEEE